MIYIITAIALYGILTEKNLIKKLMCLNIIEGMVILIFLKSGFYQGRVAPVITDGRSLDFVNPLPHALMLTAIVISVCFNALAVILIVKLYKVKRTIRTDELE